ncbi:MAG: thioredoxin-dependent thiol peroxidase [Chloroflexi bacterium]|nr:thioredoxin-dependent thiol peroxidase [Chloroflexota bacterium]
MKPQIGDMAPQFELEDQDGKTHKLSDYLGTPVVLYFYPKDNTPGCTAQACSFRDSFADYRQKGITVLGVSKDSAKSHAKFQDKFSLPFTLLADVEHKVAEAYGVWVQKKFMGREYMGMERTTFIIDKDGKIVHILEKVKPQNHAEEVLALFE